MKILTIFVAFLENTNFNIQKEKDTEIEKNVFLNFRELLDSSISNNSLNDSK